MAREQTRGTQHQHSIALMIAKQALTLAQKLLLLVSHSTTDSATTPPFAILPGKAPELISIMESLLPWTLRLTLLRLVCALSCQHKLQLLLHHGSRGLSCLHEWLLAANDITDMAKREALQLALLQTLAILGHAHRRLVQPWMLLAASKLARSSPLHSVRLAAVKFKRLSEMQAASQAPGEGSSTDNKRLTCVALYPSLLSGDIPSCLTSLTSILSGRRAVDESHINSLLSGVVLTWTVPFLLCTGLVPVV